MVLLVGFSLFLLVKRIKRRVEVLIFFWKVVFIFFCRIIDGVLGGRGVCLCFVVCVCSVGSNSVSVVVIVI